MLYKRRHSKGRGGGVDLLLLLATGGWVMSTIAPTECSLDWRAAPYCTQLTKISAPALRLKVGGVGSVTGDGIVIHGGSLAR